MKEFGKVTIFLTALAIVGCSNQTTPSESETESAGHSHDREHGHGHSHDHAHGHDHSHHGHSHAHPHDHDHAHPHDHSHGGTLSDGFTQDIEALVAHDHAPNHGMMVPLESNGVPVGYAEVKLHDDKGDIELWLTLDKAGTQPMDLPLDTMVSINLPKLEPAGVSLKIRNDVENEDENGNSTIRDGKTNYFIFPGDTGVDATFLTGKDFASPAQVALSIQGAQVYTKEFVLRPHVH